MTFDPLSTSTAQQAFIPPPSLSSADSSSIVITEIAQASLGSSGDLSSRSPDKLFSAKRASTPQATLPSTSLDRLTSPSPLTDLLDSISDDLECLSQLTENYQDKVNKLWLCFSKNPDSMLTVWIYLSENSRTNALYVITSEILTRSPHTQTSPEARLLFHAYLVSKTDKTELETFMLGYSFEHGFSGTVDSEKAKEIYEQKGANPWISYFSASFSSRENNLQAENLLSYALAAEKDHLLSKMIIADLLLQKKELGKLKVHGAKLIDPDQKWISEILAQPINQVLHTPLIYGLTRARHIHYRQHYLNTKEEAKKALKALEELNPCLPKFEDLYENTPHKKVTPQSDEFSTFVTKVVTEYRASLETISLEKKRNERAPLKEAPPKPAETKNVEVIDLSSIPQKVQTLRKYLFSQTSPSKTELNDILLLDGKARKGKRNECRKWLRKHFSQYPSDIIYSIRMLSNQKENTTWRFLCRELAEWNVFFDASEDQRRLFQSDLFSYPKRLCEKFDVKKYASIDLKEEIFQNPILKRTSPEKFLGNLSLNKLQYWDLLARNGSEIAQIAMAYVIELVRSTPSLLKAFEEKDLKEAKKILSQESRKFLKEPLKKGCTLAKGLEEITVKKSIPDNPMRFLNPLLMIWGGEDIPYDTKPRSQDQLRTFHSNMKREAGILLRTDESSCIIS